MSKQENFYGQLVKYFETTPRKKILEDWAKSAEFDKVGPTVEEFTSELASKLKEVLNNMSQEEFDSEWKKIVDLNIESPSFIGEKLENIELEEVLGSRGCQFSIVENKLATLYRNQEKILTAIKRLSNENNK